MKSSIKFFFIVFFIFLITNCKESDFHDDKKAVNETHKLSNPLADSNFDYYSYDSLIGRGSGVMKNGFVLTFTKYSNESGFNRLAYFIKLAGDSSIVTLKNFQYWNALTLQLCTSLTLKKNLINIISNSLNEKTFKFDNQLNELRFDLDMDGGLLSINIHQGGLGETIIRIYTSFENEENW
jgi:hypothetical protein